MKYSQYATTQSTKVQESKKGSFRLPPQAAIGLILILACSFLSAQSQSSNAQSENAQTGGASAKSAVLFAAPDKGFDPVNASDDELARYGFPPRPSINDAIPYSRWKRLVTSPQTRLTNLTFKATNVIHGKAKNMQQHGLVGNVTAASSDNWSAYAVTAAAGTFKANGSYIYSEWNVPAVGVENCSYTPYMSSQWVGFDGAFVSNDVLQAGTEIDGCPSNYYAWYEWYTADCLVNSSAYPCYSFSFNLPVNPGDLMLGEVWYTTTAPNGHAFLYNYTTQQSASIAFYQPPSWFGVGNYQGNSVEWVVERPNGGAPNLTNYVADQFNWTLAYDGSAYFYPGSSPSGTTTYNISMTCPPWNPSSECTATTTISSVDLFGLDTLWFYNWYPSYQ